MTPEHLKLKELAEKATSGLRRQYVTPLEVCALGEAVLSLLKDLEKAEQERDEALEREAEARAEAAVLGEAMTDLVHRCSMLCLSERTPEFLSSSACVKRTMLEELRKANGQAQQEEAEISLQKLLRTYKDADLNFLHAIDLCIGTIRALKTIRPSP